MTYLSRIRKKPAFKQLTDSEKLLLYTLIHNPYLSKVGVLVLNNPMEVSSELGWSLEKLREVSKGLRKKGVLFMTSHQGVAYLVLKDFAIKKPKGQKTIELYKSILEEYPDKVREATGIEFTIKPLTFSKPTAEEVTMYARSQGYDINGQDFVSYYDDISERMGVTDLWYDKRGRQIKDWRSKVRNVWFSPKRRLQPLEGAPKGFEYFFVLHEGKIITPDFWSDGKPKSKQFYLNKILLDGFNSWKKSS